MTPLARIRREQAACLEHVRAGGDDAFNAAWGFADWEVERRLLMEEKRLTGATMFSGIGAPEVALPWISWQWCAEVEPFPCAVLAHHHPEIPNLGDVTADDFTERARKYGAIDFLVAGAPCQDFSVAGQRAGMGGARGNLSLRFVELVGELRPRWLLFENVPGLLSSASHLAPDAVPPPDDLQPGCEWTVEDSYEADEGSDFGFFLSALSELGYQFSWTVLDAQYFGVAQRRERVFVVGSLGDWTRAAAVLLDRESLSGNTPPRRKAGERVAGCVTPGAHPGSYNGQDAYNDRLIPEIAMCPNVKGDMGRIDGESETFIAHSLRADGFDASEDGTGRGTPIVPVASSTLKANYGGGGFGSDPSETFVPVAVPILEAGARTGKSTTDPRAGIGIGEPGDPMFTLQSGKQHAVAFDARNSAVSDIALPLQAGGIGTERGGCINAASLICFSCKDHGSDAGGIAPTLRSMSHDGSHANAGGQVAVALSSPTMAVRRLTPRECERLQGFPDDYTLIEHRGKPAADGPRYKAIGNSMAVPVIRWIGERIRKVDAATGDDAAGGRGVREI